MCHVLFASIFYSSSRNKRKQRRNIKKNNNKTHQITAKLVKKGVYPRCVDGEIQNTKRRKQNVNNKYIQKGKYQVNGQIYDRSQMPTANDDKGFVHVIRSPNTSEDKYIFEIIISGTISIYIEYKKGRPSEFIENL